ncbi:LysE family translocator [Alteribacillus sp. HJP-4]|uniref:LysE family translocator n=1 Tax=Alteribacillus sp. HJP-4 TaxID=2775394 RepID=UPI0035CCFED4
MELIVLLSFLGTAAALTIAPGPDILFVAAQSSIQNKKAGIITALGLCTGLLVHITAAAAGISALLYQSSVTFTAVKITGAAYLLYLAWQAFRSKNGSESSSTHTEILYSDLYKKGILMNLLNPKVSLFFLALLPQFTTTGSLPIVWQIFILGVIFLVQALIIFSVVSILAGKINQWLTGSSRFSKRLNFLQGSLFTVIGLQILFSEK